MEMYMFCMSLVLSFLKFCHCRVASFYICLAHLYCYCVLRSVEILYLLCCLQPYVRKEACMGLYRLCLGCTVDNKHGHGFLQPILSCLLSFITDALLFKPQKNSEVGLIIL